MTLGGRQRQVPISSPPYQGPPPSSLAQPPCPSLGWSLLYSMKRVKNFRARQRGEPLLYRVPGFALGTTLWVRVENSLSIAAQCSATHVCMIAHKTDDL